MTWSDSASTRLFAHRLRSNSDRIWPRSLSSFEPVGLTASVKHEKEWYRVFIVNLILQHFPLLLLHARLELGPKTFLWEFLQFLSRMISSHIHILLSGVAVSRTFITERSTDNRLRLPVSQIRQFCEGTPLLTQYGQPITTQHLTIQSLADTQQYSSCDKLPTCK